MSIGARGIFPGVVFAIVVGIMSPVGADEPPPAAPAAQPGPPPAPPPEFPKFEDVTKGMEVKEGFLTLYHDKKEDKLLAAVPKALIKKNFLGAASIAAGGPMTGWQWGDGVFYFERQNKKLVLMEADPRYSKGADSPVSDVIARTYTDRIVQAVAIETETPGGDPVINLDRLLKTGLGDMGSALDGQIDPSLSRYAKIKPFPDNVELAVDLAVMGKAGQGGSFARVHYSFSRLAETDYKPRAADERVGYFLTVQKDWTVPHDARTVFKRYVNRWYLKKADPTQDVSDATAETQIVFYIEKTVPVKYRRYVRDGILEWNKAFEKAGIRNAVQVRQQTDKTFAELDPEDCRYNFFRWGVSGTPYAVGPSRCNPFTGQIYDADIVFDDAMLRYLESKWRVNQPRALGDFTDPVWAAFLDAHPEWDPAPGPAESRPAAVCSHTDEPSSFGGEEPPVAGGGGCEMGRGMVRQLRMAGLLMRAAGKENLPEEYVGQAIKETVMHEVGHTLGLRHNFKASSWKPLAEIRDSTAPDEPTSGSVMDYNDLTFAASKAEQGVFVTPTLGPYDYWAIEYAYRQPSGEIKKEEDLLRQIAGRVAEPGLAYATDEDTSMLGPDPLSLPWDMGADPLDFARDRVERFQRLLADAGQWAVADGESYSELRSTFATMLQDYAFGVFAAAREVGGQYLRRDRRGDPNGRDPIEIVPASTQRAALQFLGETVLSPSAFAFDSAFLNRLAPARWNHWDTDAFDESQEFPVHGQVRAIQVRLLLLLLNPTTVNRLYDAELKVPAGEDALTVPELFDTVTGLVWRELKDDGSATTDNRRPRINSFRRNLQRAHVDTLLRVLLARGGAGYEADVVAVVRSNLAALNGRIGAVLEAGSGRLDGYSRAHLEDVRTRISKALEADYQAN